jgi:hypothetical protein
MAYLQQMFVPPLETPATEPVVAEPEVVPAPEVPATPAMETPAEPKATKSASQSADEPDESSTINQS